MLVLIKGQQGNNCRSCCIIMTKLSGIKATLWKDGMYYTEVTGKKHELSEAPDIPLPDAVVFTKDELENMKEDDAAEEE